MSLPGCSSMERIRFDNVTVVILNDSPYSFGNMSLPKPGISVELVQMFCKVSQVNCNFTVENNKNYGNFINGSWSGVVKSIIDGTYDISIPAFNPTISRLEVIDFSLPVDIGDYVLVTRRPTVNVGSMDIITAIVFDWSVWICLIFFSFALSLILQFSQEHTFQKNSSYSVIKNCIDLFSVISNQGFQFHQTVTKWSAKFLYLFWVISVIVLNSIYSTFIVSSVISSKGKLPFTDFKSFVDCLERKQCTQYIFKEQLQGGSTYEWLFKSNFSEYIRFRNILGNNPPVYINESEGFKSVLLEQFNYNVIILNRFRYMYNTESNKMCYYYTVSFDRLLLTFSMSKHSKLKRKINKFVTNITKFGFTEGLYSRYLNGEKQCDANSFRENIKPVNVICFLSYLFVLIIGSCIALIVLWLEIIKKMTQVRKRYIINV